MEELEVFQKFDEIAVVTQYAHRVLSENSIICAVLP